MSSPENTTPNKYDAAEILRLADADRRHIWQPFTQMQEYLRAEPLLIARADGPYLYDAHGNRLLDGISSLWCNVHGHRQPHIDAAIRAQLERVAHSTLLGPTHEPAVEFAARLVGIAPAGLTRVFYSDNGATACEVALKMAFQYWQNRAQDEKRPALAEKTKFIRLREAYHGDTIGAVSVGGIELFHRIFHPLLFHTVAFPVPVPSFADARAQVAALIEERAHETAAFILEPLVQGAGGMLVHQDGFLAHVREITRACDVLLICDEVATGFGRTGRMFACEHEQVTPDLMTLGKGITGGYLPLAATLTTEDVFRAFLGTANKTFLHGHTYTGNPLACAAGIASLDVFEREHVLEGLPPKIERLSSRARAQTDHPHVGEVRLRGMMGGIELVKDKEGSLPYDEADRIGARVCDACRAKGVLLRPLGPVIVLMPPLCISLDQIDCLMDAVCEAIDEVCGRT